MVATDRIDIFSKTGCGCAVRGPERRRADLRSEGSEEEPLKPKRRPAPLEGGGEAWAASEAKHYAWEDARIASLQVPEGREGAAAAMAVMKGMQDAEARAHKLQVDQVIAARAAARTSQPYVGPSSASSSQPVRGPQQGCGAHPARDAAHSQQHPQQRGPAFGGGGGAQFPSHINEPASVSDAFAWWLDPEAACGGSGATCGVVGSSSAATLLEPMTAPRAANGRVGATPFGRSRPVVQCPLLEAAQYSVAGFEVGPTRLYQQHPAPRQRKESRPRGR